MWYLKIQDHMELETASSARGGQDGTTASRVHQWQSSNHHSQINSHRGQVDGSDNLGSANIHAR